MPTNQELRELLIEAGARPTPRPDADFVAALEARLLNAPSQVETDPAQADEFTVAARKRSRRIPTLVAASVAVAAIGLIGVFVAVPKQSNDLPEISLASSTNTIVELPDGSKVQGRDGLDLPEGSIVRTGPDGHAEVGNVDLGPDQEAVVSGGRIVITTATTLPVITLPPITLPPVTLPPVTLPVTVPSIPGL